MMNLLIGILVFFIALGLHCLVSVLVTKTLKEKADFKDYSGDASPEAVFMGVFWPISIVPLLLYHSPKMIKSIYHRFQIFCSALPKNKNELFPGVERPSRILAQMVAARIVKDFNALSYGKWETDDLIVSWEKPRLSGRELRSFEITVKGKTIRIDEKDWPCLVEAVTTAEELKDEKRKAEDLAKKENQALEIIEHLTLG